MNIKDNFKIRVASGYFFKAVIFIVILFLLDFLIGFFLKNPLATGDLQGRLALHDMYQSSQIDIAFLGSSNIYSAIDPYLLEKKLDCRFTVFDAATSSAMPIDSYYYLKELVRTDKKPKAVFLDVFYPGYQNSVFYDAPEHSLYLYDYLKLSWNKVEYFKNAFSGNDKIFAVFNAKRYLGGESMPTELLQKAKDNMEIKLNSPWYRRYAPHGNDKGEYVGKGYRYLTKGMESGTLGTQIYLTWDEENICDDAVGYLESIYRLCEKENVELILISPPLAPSTRIGMGNYEDVHLFFQKFAEEKEIEFWDFNYIQNKWLELEDEDFYDQHHLSKSGAEKFTAVVADLIDMSKDIRKIYFYKEYKDVVPQYKQVAGVSVEKDEENQILRAKSIQESGVQVIYDFYTSDDQVEYELLKSSFENTILLSDIKSRYVKVVAYNAAPIKQREVYAEIEIMPSEKEIN